MPSETKSYTPGAERVARKLAAEYGDMAPLLVADLISRETHDTEMLEALKEAREVCAACFRVINRCGPDAVSGMENEIANLGIALGFGARWQELIAKVEGR